jgi:hypothetical protein
VYVVWQGRHVRRTLAARCVRQVPSLLTKVRHPLPQDLAREKTLSSQSGLIQAHTTPDHFQLGLEQDQLAQSGHRRQKTAENDYAGMYCCFQRFFSCLVIMYV